MNVLDTNVILRYVIWDGEELFEKSKEIFKEIKLWNIEAEIPVYIVMEIVFVLHKYYNVALHIVVEHVKNILSFPGIVNVDKSEIIRALDIHLKENIDLADALLVWYAEKNYVNVISFDKKINKLIWKNN